MTSQLVNFSSLKPSDLMQTLPQGCGVGGQLSKASGIPVELVFAPTAEVARERGQSRVTERPLMTTKLE